MSDDSNLRESERQTLMSATEMRIFFMNFNENKIDIKYIGSFNTKIQN